MAADFVIHIPIGSMLGSKYRVEKLLGHGGMGAVYLAENVDIGRKVAIKVLHADFANDPGILQRFRMEARATAAIGHPGIVDVLDLGTTNEGSEFIVMERLEGETLGAKIKRAQTGLPPGELVPIICDVLDALAAAHEKKIVHRDLKPENIFLTDRPVKAAKILDFGISKFAGTEDVSLTRTGTVMGSPLYMSPEQARGAKDINHSTDLYSIGAILYEGLAGVPPFTGATYNEVIANVLMEKHKPLVELKPELSPAISAVVDSLLAKYPSDRPTDARAAKMELRRAYQPGATDIDVPTVRHSTSAQPAQPATQARASIAPEAATRPAPDLPTAVVAAQRKTLGVVVGIGAVIVVAVGGFAYYRKSQQKPEEKPPAAVITPPPVAPPAAPPAPAKLRLQLSSDPSNATWTYDGNTLGECRPCTVEGEVGSTHPAFVRAPGYLDKAIDVVLDPAKGDRFSVKLDPAPVEKGHGKHPKAPGSVATPVVHETPHATEKPPEKKDPGSLTIDKSNPFK
jgi:serine/threonine-protein kinase